MAFDWNKGTTVGKAQSKVSILQGEAQKSQEAAKKASSPLGFAWNAIKALPGAAAETLIGTPAKFLASTAEIPETVIKGKAAQRTYDLPLLKPFKSYQSEAEKIAGDIIEGKQGLPAMGMKLAEVPLAGLETAVIAKGATKLIPKAAEKVVGTAQKGISFLSKAREAKKLVKVAETISPNYALKKEATRALSAGQVKVSALTRTPKIAPTQEQLKVAQTVKDLVKPGTGLRRATKNIKNLSTEIGRISEDEVKPFLKSYPNQFSYQELNSYIKKNVIPSESIKVTDPQGIFEKVKDFALNYVKKSGAANNEKLWDARKTLDTEFKKEFGDLLYDVNSPAHLPVKNAWFGVRRALNQFIGTKTPGGQAGFLDKLDKMSDMYDAMDNIVAKNYKLITQSPAKRLFQTAKKAATGAAITGGLYGAYRMFK